MNEFGMIKTFGYTVRLLQDGQQFYENVFKNEKLIIGRDNECDINIQSPSISRKHLQIEIDDDKLYVTDLGSSNGTIINDNKIIGRTQINSKSRIKAGRITIQVILPEPNLSGV
jgi:pSer/pThr/pTyr-binding forkhead associated (FHA) protein